VFVFKDESEAQRQPLNFPTLWDNFGGSLFLLSLLLPVFTHTRAKCFRKTKKQRDCKIAKLSIPSKPTTRE
jgi:hypothetical protein